MKRSVASQLFLAALALPCTAQTLVRSVDGPAANAQYGRACMVVPDQNGDGFKDVLVGAPGFNQERGEILCLSGRFLATGSGTQTLWSVAPAANPGDLFGEALADVGDVTGDGVHDFLIGQPGYDNPGVNDVGAVRLVNGLSHSVVSLIHGVGVGEAVGTAIAATGDIDHDAKSEVLIGAPAPTQSTSTLYLFPGQFLTGNYPITTYSADSAAVPGSAELGTSIAAGFDPSIGSSGPQSLFAVGMPGYSANAGAVWVGVVASTGTGMQLAFGSAFYTGSNASERLGTAVDAARDYDGDGYTDVVAGAPNFRDASGGQVGRVALISWIHAFLGMAPFELRSWVHPTATPGLDHHFGAVLRVCDDLNGDGVRDILVGSPNFTVPILFGQIVKGELSVFSGASFARLAGITGGLGAPFGDGIAGAVDDYDGDGFKEFVAAASLADGGGTDSGAVRCYRLFPIPPSIYCSGKVNSLGCTPSISSSGSPSMSSTAPFNITATNFVNQKNGLLFYSAAPNAVLFQGGTKCVANPTVRTPVQGSGGATSGSSCTGAYSFDFNHWIANGWDFSLGAGNEIYAQYWSRDPQSASHTGLSNAIRFVINP